MDELYGMHGSVYAEVPPKSPKKIIIHEKKSQNIEKQMQKVSF